MKQCLAAQVNLYFSSNSFFFILFTIVSLLIAPLTMLISVFARLVNLLCTPLGLLLRYEIEIEMI
jgi:hypothetical protein